MRKPFHILVVDDEPDIRGLVQEVLQDEGFEISTAEDGEAARAQVVEMLPDLVLLDIWMPDEDGISLLEYWRVGGELPFPVIIMSGHGTVDTAVEATRLGASSFIEKPLTTAKLLQAIGHVLPAPSAPVKRRRARIPAGTSKIGQELRKDAKRLSQSKAALMVSGPSGIGKTDFAFYVHTLSAYADKNFVVMDEDRPLSDLPPSKTWGSFLIKNLAMHSGTSQQKLVELLTEEREKNVDFRLMATDKIELRTLIEQKTVGEALGDLLQGEQIILPPLAERNEDIPDLIGACVDYHCHVSGLPYRRFSIAAQNFLLHYSWPENMRELDALVVRFLKNGGSEQITLEEARTGLRNGKVDGLEPFMEMPLREARTAFERAYLESRLREAGGNVTRLAELVDIERTHLYRKLKSLGIPFGEREDTS